MRRKDREMDRDFALDIIDKSEYGVLGIVDGDTPYTVPLSIVRDEDKLYFHSAIAGKKVELLKDGCHVSISFAISVNVPNLFTREEIENMIEKGEFASMGSKVFTTEFKSAHIIGRCKKVEDKSKKISALMLICKKYTPDIYDLAYKFIEKSLNRTNVYEIDIEEIKGKRKAFGPDRNELKWGMK
ncbi:MAG: pyridoxamine 5'-phosphate oxidase family protein [Tissierellia bacterium]|nr:pyridoxamine 5'-phosphate oxidase family protein [Tissierellia bacterium]